MTPLPTTSPDEYLTGTSAMTIPSEDTSFVKWHFVDTFLNPRRAVRFRVAGRNYPSTATLLGNFGVRECGEVLRKSGVPLAPALKFWAANRDRALLDLIIANLQEGKSLDHLSLEEYFDNAEDRRSFDHTLESIRHRLSGLSINTLDAWLTRQ